MTNERVVLKVTVVIKIPLDESLLQKYVGEFT